MRRNVFSLLALGFFGMMLATLPYACGGGGGGGDGTTQDQTQQASLSQQNIEEVLNFIVTTIPGCTAQQDQTTARMVLGLTMELAPEVIDQTAGRPRLIRLDHHGGVAKQFDQRPQFPQGFVFFRPSW